MANGDGARITSVGDLRTALLGLPDELPVKVHLGWDLDIVDRDHTEEGLVLFADDSDVAAVNREWLERTHPGGD